MTTNLRLKTLFLSIFFFTIALFLIVVNIDKQERIDNELNKQIENLKNHYTLTQDYFISDVKLIEEQILKDKEISSIFKTALIENKRDQYREKLYKKLTPMYERFRKKGILQFQFVFKDNISFLRMHRPDKYGDDLSSIRYSFNYANKNKKSISGFEQGRTTHAFRYVFPFIDLKGEHLGSVELSLSSTYIQEKLINVNKIDSHFLVNKDIFKTKAWDSKYLVTNYLQSIEHKDYMYSYEKGNNTHHITDKGIIKDLRGEIDKGIKSAKPFSVYSFIDNNVKVITFLPIFNTQNTKLAALLVSYDNSEYISSLHSSFTSLNIIFALSLAVAAYFLYKNFRTKVELKNIVKLQEEELEIQYKKNMDHELKLMRQAKMASMGEMIGNIAHQWRQPLGSIKLIASEVKLYEEMGQKNEIDTVMQMGYIISRVDYLSQTIETFRNYLKDTKSLQKVSLQKKIKDALGIVSLTLNDNHIKLIDKIDHGETIDVTIVPGELMEVLINIINNAKDAIIENNIEGGKIIVDLKQKGDKAVITIEDNGGGIPEKIIDKIFEKYFTTKDEFSGTGLGLHMSYQIITGSLKGELYVKNVNDGARFYIVIPF